MVERLRYSMAATLLPASHVAAWHVKGYYGSPCFTFNPRYLMTKQVFGSVSDLGRSSCDEAREAPELSAGYTMRQCGLHANGTVLGMLGAIRLLHASAAARTSGLAEWVAGRGAEATTRVGPDCGSVLVLNLAGLHAAARGNLSLATYGAALREALRVAIETGTTRCRASGRCCSVAQL